MWLKTDTCCLQGKLDLIKYWLLKEFISNEGLSLVCVTDRKGNHQDINCCMCCNKNIITRLQGPPPHTTTTTTMQPPTAKFLSLKLVQRKTLQNIRHKAGVMKDKRNREKSDRHTKESELIWGMWKHAIKLPKERKLWIDQNTALSIIHQRWTVQAVLFPRYLSGSRWCVN